MFIKDSGPLVRSAHFRASSYDAEANTVSVVLSTGAAVARYDWDGEFQEVLDLNQDWPEQVPFLDSHSRSSVDDRIGFVGSIETIDGELRGIATLSRHNERAKIIAAELADGHSFGVSIGYKVDAWEEAEADGKRTKTATKIELLEASLTTVPADIGAGTRSQNIAQTQGANMPNQTRSEINTEIRSIAKTTGLDQAWIDTQIDAEADLDAVRAAALDAMKTTANIQNTSHNDNTMDNPAARQEAATEAMYARYNTDHTPSEQARKYIGMSTVDLARDSLRAAGVQTTGLQAASVVERALHSTSDFPIILGDSVGRTLRAAYEAAPSGLKIVGRKTTAKDFRDKHRVQLSEAPNLEKVDESGEFKSGTLAEAKESYALATYGKIVGLTRQAIVNDDLGAFSDMARRMGQAAAATEAKLLVDLLTEGSGLGPVMSDGKKLFHADHKNIGEAMPMSVTSISNARVAMLRQTGLTGAEISVAPKFLVVPPELQTLAEQLMTLVAATKPEDANTLAGTLDIVVDQRLTDTDRWYVAADPAQMDGLEYAYLEGQEGVQIETKAGFEVDGVQIRARTDFGAGFVDHRGWFTNAGA